MDCMSHLDSSELELKAAGGTAEPQGPEKGNLKELALSLTISMSWPSSVSSW